jgi:hypothetical protein
MESLNIAHDVLINELLCDTMGFADPPLEGLSWHWFIRRYEAYRRPLGLPVIPDIKEKASQYSLEELVRIIISSKEHNFNLNRNSWKKPFPIPDPNREPSPFENHPFADLFAEADPEEKDGQKTGGKITLDMIGDDLEESLFPEEDKASRSQRKNELEKVCLDAAALNVLFPASSVKMRGDAPGNFVSDIEIVKSKYAPPWEMAMQHWFDGVTVPKRSWARASRRGAWRTDVVLPGRNQDCFMLHIILDTSGSMGHLIPLVLAQISVFARNVAMEQVHILQCDTEVTDDEFVEIDQLEKYRVNGFGGSDMSPAMLKLAEDPEITHVLVITDGYIDYPEETDIPYEVLWCIPDEGNRLSFPYGQIIYVPISDAEYDDNDNDIDIDDEDFDYDDNDEE